jgi:hypothetical protein
MRLVAEPISDLRLQRFHRWAMPWLKWFAAFLEGAVIFAPLSKQAQSVGHSWLDRIERTVMAIVMLRAVRNVRRINPRKGVAEHRRKESARACCAAFPAASPAAVRSRHGVRWAG